MPAAPLPITASPPREVYYTSPIGRVYLHPDDYCVVIEWYEYREPDASALLRALYERAYDLLRQSTLTRILTDHRRMGPIEEDDQHWLGTEWVPRAVYEAGYSHVAVVDGEDVLNRLSTDTVVLAISKLPVVVRYFDDPVGAEAWLLAT